MSLAEAFNRGQAAQQQVFGRRLQLEEQAMGLLQEQELFPLELERRKQEYALNGIRVRNELELAPLAQQTRTAQEELRALNVANQYKTAQDSARNQALLQMENERVRDLFAQTRADLGEDLDSEVVSPSLQNYMDMLDSNPRFRESIRTQEHFTAAHEHLLDAAAANPANRAFIEKSAAGRQLKAIDDRLAAAGQTQRAGITREYEGLFQQLREGKPMERASFDVLLNGLGNTIRPGTLPDEQKEAKTKEVKKKTGNRWIRGMFGDEEKEAPAALPSAGMNEDKREKSILRREDEGQVPEDTVLRGEDARQTFETTPLTPAGGISTGFQVYNVTRERLAGAGRKTGRTSRYGNRLVSLDFNDVKVRKGQKGIEVKVPKDAKPDEIRAAKAYAKQVQALFKANGHNINLRGDEGVKRDGSGKAGYFHLEPFFVEDKRSFDIIRDNSDTYAEILAGTFGKLDGVTFIPPHEAKATGAEEHGYSETKYAQEFLIPALQRFKERGAAPMEDTLAARAEAAPPAEAPSTRDAPTPGRRGLYSAPAEGTAQRDARGALEIDDITRVIRNEDAKLTLEPKKNAASDSFGDELGGIVNAGADKEHFERISRLPKNQRLAAVQDYYMQEARPFMEKHGTGDRGVDFLLLDTHTHRGGGASEQILAAALDEVGAVSAQEAARREPWEFIDALTSAREAFESSDEWVDTLIELRQSNKGETLSREEMRELREKGVNEGLQNRWRNAREYATEHAGEGDVAVPAVDPATADAQPVAAAPAVDPATAAAQTGVAAAAAEAAAPPGDIAPALPAEGPQPVASPAEAAPRGTEGYAQVLQEVEHLRAIKPTEVPAADRGNFRAGLAHWERRLAEEMRNPANRKAHAAMQLEKVKEAAALHGTNAMRVFPMVMRQLEEGRPFTKKGFLTEADKLLAKGPKMDQMPSTEVGGKMWRGSQAMAQAELVMASIEEESGFNPAVVFQFKTPKTGADNKVHVGAVGKLDFLVQDLTRFKELPILQRESALAWGRAMNQWMNHALRVESGAAITLEDIAAKSRAAWPRIAAISADDPATQARAKNAVDSARMARLNETRSMMYAANFSGIPKTIYASVDDGLENLRNHPDFAKFAQAQKGRRQRLEVTSRRFNSAQEAFDAGLRDGDRYMLRDASGKYKLHTLRLRKKN